MYLKKLMMFVGAIAVVVSLGACGSLVQSGGGGEEQQSDQGNQQSEQGNQEQQGNQGNQEDQGNQGNQQQEDQGGGEQAATPEAPDDTTLSLTIPSIDKTIEGIPSGRGDDVQLLTDNAAVHVQETGFPWEQGANVFLAGHVEGYEGTPSYKAFDGIQQLQNGDEIIVTDANGQEYSYSVYESRIIQPTELTVLDPVPGRSVVTLQTCEIVNVNPDGTPDYSNTERLIVQAELQS